MLENYVLHNYENKIYIWTILVSSTKAFPSSAEPLIQHKFQAASENESPCIYNTPPPPLLAQIYCWLVFLLGGSFQIKSILDQEFY